MQKKHKRSIYLLFGAVSLPFCLYLRNRFFYTKYNFK